MLKPSYVDLAVDVCQQVQLYSCLFSLFPVLAFQLLNKFEYMYLVTVMSYYLINKISLLDFSPVLLKEIFLNAVNFHNQTPSVKHFNG